MNQDEPYRQRQHLPVKIEIHESTAGSRGKEQHKLVLI